MSYYIDSNVFIYSVTEEAVSGKAREVLRKVEDSEVDAATSTLTLDEVVWIVKNEANRETAIETGRRLLAMENLKILEADVDTGINSLQVMEENTSIDPRDAIHIASALEHGADRIVSEDSDLKKIDQPEVVSTAELLEK